MIAAELLLIDIGNTAVKLRLATPARLLGKTRRFPTTELTAATLKKALDDWTYAFVIVSSVVPDAAQKIARIIPELVLVTSALDTGVDLRGYPGVKTLGADRLANLAGASALHGPGPLIVVDFGTAATFNALDARSRFLGGIIAPGLTAMADYLPVRTAQLPPIRLTGAAPAAIGRNTREAMRAGAILGYRGLIRELLASLRAELAPKDRHRVRVVATGGNAAQVAVWLPGEFDAVDADLTLQGLRVIGRRNYFAHIQTTKNPSS